MASCGQAPEPSEPVRKRERVAELLGCGADRDALLAAVDAWRKAAACIDGLGAPAGALR
jgi:hypothetical protein